VTAVLTESAQTMRRATVLLADDHRVFTEGLVHLQNERFRVIGTVREGAAVIEAARRLRPEVIVMDLSMPTMSGLDALRQMNDQGLESKVIVLTMHADARLATEALRAGASGFVLKEASGEELVTAIDAALEGRTYLTTALTRDVLDMMSRRNDPAAVQLTPRQVAVLRLIVDGLRMKEIASALDLSPRTVETIKYELMHELKIHSTAELVRYAIEHRLTGL
jgi:DNA-binding NarL/FixJ family response regulator